MEGTLEVALLQTSLNWHSPADNRNHFEALIKLLDYPIDLIVLPEMFSTGFTMEPQKIARDEAQITLDWMRALASEVGAALMGSIVVSSEDTFYNRLYFVPPVGEIEYYDKRHTFTLAGEDKVYTAGNEKLIVTYKGFKICPLICYDLRFPVWSRNVEGYDVLVYVANWPEKRIQAWDTLLQARAIENMAYAIGVNRVGEDANGYRYNGHSAVYDTLGKRLAYADTEAVIRATLEKDHIAETREKLKFLEDRDTFSLEW